MGTPPGKTGGVYHFRGREFPFLQAVVRALSSRISEQAPIPSIRLPYARRLAAFGGMARTRVHARAGQQT